MTRGRPGSTTMMPTTALPGALLLVVMLVLALSGSETIERLLVGLAAGFAGAGVGYISGRPLANAGRAGLVSAWLVCTALMAGGFAAMLYLGGGSTWDSATTGAVVFWSTLGYLGAFWYAVIPPAPQSPGSDGSARRSLVRLGLQFASLAVGMAVGTALLVYVGEPLGLWL